MIRKYSSRRCGKLFAREKIKSPSCLELSGANVRAWVAVLIVMTMSVESASAQSNCERKDADPAYCHEGKPRAVCLENGHLVWRDTHDAVSQGELAFLAMGGKVSKPKCSEKPKEK